MAEFSPISTPFTHLDDKQRTVDWYTDRWGKITSSNLSKINAPKGLGQTGVTYLNSLLYERMQGVPSEKQIENMELDLSWETKLGKEHEPAAREKLSKALGIDIEEVGFIHYPGFEGQAGDSSDGIFEYQGCTIPVELKTTMKSETFMKRCQLITDSHSDFWQCQGHMIAYGAPFMIYGVYDFASDKPDNLDYQVVFRSETHVQKAIISIQKSIEILIFAFQHGLKSVTDDITLAESYKKCKSLPNFIK